MTGLVEWAFARARTIFVLIALAFAGGIYSYGNLPREGEPQIDIPILYVSVSFRGVSVEDNENLVAKPIEDELASVTGLKEMTTFVSDGHTGVLLEFDVGFDQDSAIDEVRAKLDDIRPSLPDDIDEPRVLEWSIAEFPIITIALSGDIPERTLTRLADNLEDKLANLPRVLEVNVSGTRKEIVEMVVDPLRLESYDTTIDRLLSAVHTNNALVQAGQVETERGGFNVKLSGTFTSVADIANTPFLTSGERTATFGDIGEIRRTFADTSSRARIDGEPAIIFEVVKAKGENIFETVEEVRATLEAEAENWPEALRSAVKLTPAIDTSVDAGRMITQLENSVATAVALILILAIALLGLRPALLIGSAIPCSFLMAFALLAAFGMSINNMVMFGLTLSVGMLIDGAIVVVEYADRRRAEGVDAWRAYRDAAKRMFWPISTSTATTLCAFLPMLLWPGIPGQFMRQLPITLILVLSSSLVVALIFLPVVGAVVHRRADRHAPAAFVTRPTGTGVGRSATARLYRAVISNALLPVAVLGAVATGMAGIVMTFAENNRGVDFFVDLEPEMAVAYVRARGNLSFEEADMLVREAEARTASIEGIRTQIATVGGGGVGGGPGGGDAGPPRDSIGQIYYEFEEWGARPHGDDIVNELIRRTSDIPGVVVEVSLPARGPSEGKPISVELRSSDWRRLLAETGVVRDKLDSVEGLFNIDDTRPLPGIEWDLRIDRNRANTLGASVVGIGTLVRLVTGGVDIGTYRPSDANDELDIRVRFPDDDRVLDTLDRLRLRTETGLVPLSSFVTRQPVPAIGSISRKLGERVVTVGADVEQGHNVTEKINEIVAWLETADLDPAVHAEFRGELEEQNESQQFLLAAFALALLLMFAVLLIQFNSFFSVFLVLLAVVLSVVGVLLGMLVMEQPFSIIMTGIGIVALAGIVVNNNIVLIDTYQGLRGHMHELDAIAGAVARRLRPVLLTTVTTIAGLCPMMFAISVDFVGREVHQGQPSALWWVQLATAIVFGLGFSTVLTLVVTPSILAIRYWLVTGLRSLGGWLAALVAGRGSFRRVRRQEARVRRNTLRTIGENSSELIWGQH